MAQAEIIARVERRGKWTPAKKAALLAELEAEGGKVAVVARRHRMSPSLLYSWRSESKAAAAARAAEPLTFVPMGVRRERFDAGADRLGASHIRERGPYRDEADAVNLPRLLRERSRG